MTEHAVKKLSGDYYDILCSIGMRREALEAMLRLDVIAFCEAGATRNQAALKFGVDARRISDILNAAGAKAAPDRKKRNGQRTEAIVAERKAGFTCPQIASKLGLSLSAVYNALSRARFVRKPGAWRTAQIGIDPEFDAAQEAMIDAILNGDAA